MNYGFAKEPLISFSLHTREVGFEPKIRTWPGLTIMPVVLCILLRLILMVMVGQLLLPRLFLNFNFGLLWLRKWAVHIKIRLCYRGKRCQIIKNLCSRLFLVKSLKSFLRTWSKASPEVPVQLRRHRLQPQVHFWLKSKFSRQRYRTSVVQPSLASLSLLWSWASSSSLCFVSAALPTGYQGNILSSQA